MHSNGNSFAGTISAGTIWGKTTEREAPLYQRWFRWLLAASPR